MAVLLLLVPLNSAIAGDAFDLDLDSGGADYQVQVLKKINAPEISGARSAYVMCGIDGDGLTEFVEGHHSKFLGYDGEDGQIKSRWQLNIDPAFRLHSMTPLLGAAADINGDGVEEIFTTLTSLDRQQWRFLVVDPATETFLVNAPLPVGMDRRPDGIWDGSYTVKGVVRDADGEGRRGVVLMRCVGYDTSLRGVYVVDPLTGEMIWEWICGPNPEVQSPSVVDIDGDGNNEIVVFGTSPDNLGGTKVNGYSDNTAVIFVLDSRGTLLWEGDIGPRYVHGETSMFDLDRDGNLEIITRTSHVPVGHTNKMVVWDGLTGRKVCQVRSEAGFLGAACAKGPRPGTGWIYAGSDDGTITRYLYDGASLARDKRALHSEPRCAVIGALDILPDEGVEILVDIAEGEILAVLNRDLELLTSFKFEVGGGSRVPALWQVESGKTSLILGNRGTIRILDFVKTPVDVAGMLRTVGLVLVSLLGLGGIFLLGRWQGRRHSGVKDPGFGADRTADREVLYRLWRQLDDVKHEKILEASRGLSRLVWLLDAYATDLGASSDLGARIQQLMGDFSEVVRPRLEGILQLAGSERFEVDTVENICAALSSLSDQLEEWTSCELTVESVAAGRENMKRDLEVVEQGLLGLWSSLRDYFSTDPVRMIEGMLLVREGEFTRARIQTEMVGAATIEDASCLIDGGDLRYVLGNLVDNAVRAMEETDTRRLLLQFERNNAEISLHVSDTGGGISPEIQDKIFSGRFSTRHGGGNGLFRSRDILQRWGGEITLADSSPGQGTTFVLHLRAARKPEMSKVLGAEA